MHFSTAGIAILIAVAAAAPAPQGGFGTGDQFGNNNNRFGTSLFSRPQNFGTDTNSLLTSAMSNPRVTQFLRTRPDLQNADQNTLYQALSTQFPDLFPNSNTNFNSLLSTDNFDTNQFGSQRWSNPNRFSGGGGGFKRRIKRDASSTDTKGGFGDVPGSFNPFQQLQSVDPSWSRINDNTFQNSLSGVGSYLQSLETQNPQLFFQILSLLGPDAFQQDYDKAKREAAAEDVAKE